MLFHKNLAKTIRVSIMRYYLVLMMMVTRVGNFGWWNDVDLDIKIRNTFTIYF